MTTAAPQRNETTPAEYELLIGGEWVAAQSGERYERRNPANGEVVATYPWAGEADVERAIQEARRAFDSGWSRSSAKTRHDVLMNVAQRIRGQIPQLGKLLSLEVGRPIGMAAAEIAMAADVFEYYAGLALDEKGESITNFAPDAIGLIVREPIGVVGVITPWNFPFLLLTWKVAPALCAGCTLVVKPSQFTPTTSLELGRIVLEAGAPAGVMNVVSGPGSSLGAYLATSPLVDKIAFTGSTEVGKSVMRNAASTVKKISLELGGKSPNIVFPDANLDAAVGGAFFAIYLNTGQVCQAGSRLLLHESIKDAFLAKLTAFTRTVKLGDPLDPATTMGPVVNEEQFRKVTEYIEVGVQEGAKLLVGGERPKGDGLDKGLFITPTIFDAVTNDMRIAREEIFGPVLSVITFKDEAEALRIANDTIYGLAAAVWTKNIDTAFRMAKGLQAGTVWVNAYHSVGIPNMPYGGYKQSGIGRELGHEGLEGYMETKSIQIKLA